MRSRALLAVAFLAPAGFGLVVCSWSQAPPLPTWTPQPAEAGVWSSAIPRDAAGTGYVLLRLRVAAGKPVTAELPVTPGVAIREGASVLCLADPQSGGGASVAVTFGGANEEPAGLGAALAAGTWQSVAITHPPEGALAADGTRVRLHASATQEAEVYMVASDPPGALAPEPLLATIGAHLQQGGQYEAALLTWEQYTQLHQGTVDAARGLLGQGDALRALGRAEEALTRYREALAAAVPSGVVPPGHPEPVAGYLANRLVSDLEGAIRERLAAMAATQENDGLVTSAAACWPPTPEAKAALMGWLQRQPPKQALDEQAVHYLISVFDVSGDRTAPCVALLPDNQPHLTRVSSPTDLKLLIAALRTASRVPVGRGAREWDLPEAQRVAARWFAAEKQGLGGDVEAAAAALEGIAGEYRGTLAEQLATLTAGQWLQYAGHAASARGAYLAVVRTGGPVALHARLGQAELDLAAGRYEEAGRAYADIAGERGDWRLRDWAAFRRAQCLEFLGRWDQAGEAYEAAAQSRLGETAAEAAFATRRLKALDADGQPTGPATIRYVGEDRTTRGDWYTHYGSESFILCAQQAPDDLVGEFGGGLTVTPRTGRAEESVRHWISRPSDTHPASPYNPVSHVRRAANWDDRGEAYPRGAGPDLWLDIGVTAPGEHRLSLYFVNDHHYYEPRRAYTVSVFDQQGRYQGGADVRFFLNGVYKQFAVTGPTTLRVLISRNLSMNALLSGVFLDPLNCETPRLPGSLARHREVAQAYRDWQATRRPRLDPLEQRQAFAHFAAACSAGSRRPSPSEAVAFLGSLADSELAARRYGPAMWAADAAAGLLAGDDEALSQHLRRSVHRLCVASELQAPQPVEAVVPWPYVEQTFARYLDAGGHSLSGEALAGFYRQTADQFAAAQPRLAGLAYERLVALVGEAALTPEDHYRITFTASDAAADAARLERVLAGGADLPNRTELELQLLGRYLVARDVAKAEGLVEQIRARAPGAESTANALYNLGLLYVRLNQTDPALTHLSAVAADYPHTPWARYAQSYLARLPVAPPQ